MVRASTATARSGGAPPPGGPRFGLRFEDGGGRLVLARPLRFALGVIEELELDLGPLRFPLDLSAGPARFRTRRTRVHAVRARIDLDALLARFVEEPYAVRAIAPPDGEGMSFELTDAFGAVAFSLAARFEGARLRLAPTLARAVHEGPAVPLVRVLAAARDLGLTLEEDRGALVGHRPLSALLMEALTPHGWRVPDDRAVRLVLRASGSRRLSIQSLGERDPGPVGDAEAFERARALAAVVAPLVAGFPDEARARWEEVHDRRRLGGEELGFGPVEVDGPVRRCVRLRQALRREDAAAAARAAEELARLEPSDAVAVDALRAAAEVALAAHPALAAELLTHACARRPSDARVALRLVEAATHRTDRGALERSTAAALATRPPGPERAALAVDAAVVCELAGAEEQAEALFERARAHRPNDPRVLLGLGRARARRGEHAAALELLDRAAAAAAEEADEEAEARALVAAAAAARRLEDRAAEELRLSRAAEVLDDAATWAALVDAREALGRSDAATRAADALLLAVGREGRASDVVADALQRGAAAALERDLAERAKAWVGALARVRPGHPRLGALGRALEERELAARASDPARLFELDPPRLGAVLARTEDPAGLLRDALATSADLDGALGALEGLRGGALGSTIADEVAPRADEVRSGEALLALIDRASTDEAKERLAAAAHARLEVGSDPGAAALALARVGAARRDTAMLRAALTRAERAGATAAARDIVDLALGVVGTGAARAALEAVRRRLAEA